MYIVEKVHIQTVHLSSKWVKITYFICAVLLLILTMYVSRILSKSILSKEVAISILGLVLLTYMIVKLLFSLFYRPYTASKVYREKIQHLTIDAVIPFYNEDLDVIKKQIASFQQQRFQNFHLHYVDDGSETDEVYRYLKSVEMTYGKLSVVRSEQNGGKRHAQCIVFPKLKGDFIFTTDSDTIFETDNLFQLLQPFEKENVLAVTGHVRVLNENATWLTKLLSIRYFNAFEVERAGQSALGSVLVCSGPNTLFRREVIHKHLDEYENQVFLGKKQTYGDDRALTNFVLRDGVALYQANAQCFTEVPTHLRRFLKQQVRWSKSFFRESYLGIKNAWNYRRFIPFMWILVELLLFPTFLASLGYIGFLILSQQFTWSNLFFLFFFTIVNSYIRNLYFIGVDKQIFMLAPIYSFIHMFFLTPIRVWALFTLRDTKWGTREINRNEDTECVKD